MSATRRASAHRSDVHEEASVKTGARRWRDFPDIHSASSAKAERHARIFGRSHSTPRRRDAPRRTSGCDLGPGLAEDADRDTLGVEIETDVRQGRLLKSLYLGTAATGSQVTRLTGAFFIVSTPKPVRVEATGGTHLVADVLRRRPGPDNLGPAPAEIDPDRAAPVRRAIPAGAHSRPHLGRLASRGSAITGRELV
jgi:hypothetical protein